MPVSVIQSVSVAAAALLLYEAGVEAGSAFHSAYNVDNKMFFYFTYPSIMIYYVSQIMNSSDSSKSIKTEWMEDIMNSFYFNNNTIHFNKLIDSRTTDW